jgi:DHA2 family multidrug resistance protein
LSGVSAALAAAPAREVRRDVVEHGARRALIVLGVMAAALMQTLDLTITNVALPTIQGTLGATQDEATWVVTAYTIAAIIVIPLTPWLVGRFGRKNYFVVSIVGFTIASVACGAADTLSILVISRVVQGAFGGELLAVGQSILRDTFPPEKLGTSQGIFAIGAIMGPALGPPLGGLLVDNWSWNWCFDINIVPGIFAALVLAFFLKDPDRAHATRIDSKGLLLLAATLGALQFVLTEGEQHYWFEDPVNVAMGLVCLVAFAWFIYHELYGTTEPVVDLRVLGQRTVWAGSILSLALGTAVLGSTYVIPQFTQGPLGFSPTLSGFLFIMRALPIAFCTPFIVRFTKLIDPRILIGAGFAIVAFANFEQARITTSQAGFWTFALPLVLSGVGSALLWIPLTIVVLGATTPQEGPKAASFVNLFVQLGGSIAVAALDVLVHSREEFHSAILGANTQLTDPAVRHFLQTDHSVAQLAGLVYTQSTILSYADASLAIATLALICLPLIFLLKRRAPEKRPT